VDVGIDVLQSAAGNGLSVRKLLTQADRTEMARSESRPACFQSCLQGVPHIDVVTPPPKLWSASGGRNRRSVMLFMKPAAAARRGFRRSPPCSRSRCLRQKRVLRRR